MARHSSPSLSSSYYKKSTTAHTFVMRPQYTSCREHYIAQEEQTEYHRKGSQFLTLTSLPTMVHTPPPLGEGVQSPFLRLPTEIRLQIYSLLVLPRKSTDLIPYQERIHASALDTFDYDKMQRGTDRLATADLNRPVLFMRTIEGEHYAKSYGRKAAGKEHLRSGYRVRGGRFRASTQETTYHCVNVPRIEDHLGILSTNKQIHAEAAELLYSSYTFDFDTHIEAVKPFFNDLTPFTRSCIKSMRFVKRAMAYDKEVDRAEWSSAMRYLTAASSNINLQRLQLGFVAGRPGPSGWERIATYSAEDFRLLRDLESMQWLQYLLEIKGLDDLKIEAIVEHCPPATNSMAMAGFIRFSASVEKGFAEFLREQMVRC